MHKYLHHIGDFMRDTVHLSTLEECFYRRALDFYYLNESPLPKETQSVFRRLRATTEEEKQAVLNVLGDFFTEEEDGFHNKRCDAEILGYKANANKNRENGKKGGRPPKNQSNENPEETQSVNLGFENESQNNLNHKPLTINQEPLTNIYNGAEKNENSDPRFDLSLSDVNTRLSMAGLKSISQQDLNVLLIQLRDAYSHKKQMVKNQILGKAFEWVKRQQETPLKQAGQSITRTTSQILAEQRMQLDQQQGQVIDVGEPKKSLLIEEVGRA